MAGQPGVLTFESDGLRLVGDLWLPEGQGPHPAVVLTGPLSGVRGQVVGTYARHLARRGIGALAFDHRNFGASEGQPRQHEDQAGRLADLRDAVSELAVHPQVDPDRLGVVGVCLGGGYALRFAATDRRVRACATVAACFNDPPTFRQGMGAQRYHEFLRGLAELATEERRSGRVEYLPAVAPDGGEAAMGGDEPFEYYGTERGAADGWENRLTRRSLQSLLTLDAASWAAMLPPTPLLVVHPRQDDYCAPSTAERVAEAAGGRLVWSEATRHIDLYDVDEYVAPACDELAAFLAETG